MNFRSEKGVVLVIAVVFIAVLLVISSAVLLYVYNQIAVNQKEFRRLQCLYACESALNYAYQSMFSGTEVKTPYPIKDTTGKTLALVDITVEPGSQFGTNTTIISCSANY